MICPLCSTEEVSFYHLDPMRSYYQCPSCTLVFVPRQDLISQSEEKNRYESHDNSEEEQGYVNYLSGIRHSILPRVPVGSIGLDYGCGKTRLLEKLFREKGLNVHSYDLYFLNDPEVLTTKYDFIILSEVIEHLRNPREDLAGIISLLKPGGSLFVKTRLLPGEKEAFSNWFYKRDRTHVQFFSTRSFMALEEIFGLRYEEEIGRDLFLFRHHGVKVIT